MPPASPSASPDPGDSTPRCGRKSRFAVASWIVLVAGLILTAVAYKLAVVYRNPGEWLPGMGQLLIGTFATGLLTFGCGLTALIRKEPKWWLALLPLLAGASSTFYFIWCLARR